MNWGEVVGDPSALRRPEKARGACNPLSQGVEYGFPGEISEGSSETAKVFALYLSPGTRGAVASEKGARPDATPHAAPRADAPLVQPRRRTSVVRGAVARESEAAVVCRD